MKTMLQDYVQSMAYMRSSIYVIFTIAARIVYCECILFIVPTQEYNYMNLRLLNIVLEV